MNSHETPKNLDFVCVIPRNCVNSRKYMRLELDFLNKSIGFSPSYHCNSTSAPLTAPLLDKESVNADIWV